MSKRQKRRSHNSNRPSISTPAVVTNQPGSITSQPAASSSWSPQRGLNQAADFNPDYSAVKKDLKRIGLLAGSFFVILIALTFILR
jgi:hypothetical protein